MTAKPHSERKSATKEEIVHRLNRDHAVLLLGDRPVVLREGTGPDGRDEIRLLSVAGFHEWTRPDYTWIANEAGGTRRQQVSKLWIDSPDRRSYDGLVFDPSRTAPASYYNLWRGFAVEPAADPSGEACSRFLAHLHDNVCGGREELFLWVVGWFAALVQEPTNKLGTSLVLRGTQGTGKTIVGRIIGSLLGPHYALVADARFIVGRFNSHLANCLLLQLDEATWGGNHDAAGKLKDLVTGDWQFIEYKGREPIKVKNYVRLLITGNNSWLIPAGLEERRFAVLDVAETARQNHAYFQAIDDEAESGGREALLAFLLGFDLTKVNLRRIPSTGALYEQKLSSLEAEQTWWMDILSRGWLPGDVLGEGKAEVDALYSDYVGQLERVGQRRKMNETRWGMELRKMAPGITKHRTQIITPAGKTRQYVYELAPLGECRLRFGIGEWTEEQLTERWQEAPIK